MTEISNTQKTALHQFYLAARQLHKTGVVPVMCVQRSFEEAISGILGEDNWRPTHVSYAAAQEISQGRAKNVQRAHGVLDDRMDRYDRTVHIITSSEMKFEEWWSFYKKHDSTVLITRDEHSSNKRFTKEDLITIPQGEQKLFVNSGFSFKVRKKVEVKWILQEILNRSAKIH